MGTTRNPTRILTEKRLRSALHDIKNIVVDEKNWCMVEVWSTEGLYLTGYGERAYVASCSKAAHKQAFTTEERASEWLRALGVPKYAVLSALIRRGRRVEY